MGLITHPHTSHNQSNWGITEIIISFQEQKGKQRPNVLCSKFETYHQEKELNLLESH